MPYASEVLVRTSESVKPDTLERTYDDLKDFSALLASLMGNAFGNGWDIHYIPLEGNVDYGGEYQLANILSPNSDVQLVCFYRAGTSSGSQDGYYEVDVYFDHKLELTEKVGFNSNHSMIFMATEQGLENIYQEYKIGIQWTSAGTFVFEAEPYKSGSSEVSAIETTSVLAYNELGTPVFLRTGSNYYSDATCTYYSPHIPQMEMTLQNTNDNGMRQSLTYQMYKMPDIVEQCMFRDIYNLENSSNAYPGKVVELNGVYYLVVSGYNCWGGLCFPIE